MNRLQLRPFEREHLPLVEPWFTDADTQQWLGGPGWPRLMLDRADRPLGEFRGAAETGRYRWLAWDRGTAVGYIDCGTYNRWTTWEGGPGGRGVIGVIDLPAGSISHVVDPVLRRRGYCAAMVTAVLAMPELAAIEMFAAAPANAGSVGCLRKGDRVVGSRALRGAMWPGRAAAPRSWYDHARAYTEMKWPHLAAASRRSTAEALTTITVALASRRRGAPDPDVLRRGLFAWAFNPGAGNLTPPTDIAAALDWIAATTPPVRALNDPAVIRGMLSECARTQAGKPAAATTRRRKRAVFYNALGYAVELGLLGANPVDRVRWKAPDVAETVDRRVVVSPAQARASGRGPGTRRAW